MGTDLNISKTHQWLSNSDQPTIISGPCSAESREQMLRTGLDLAKDKRINILRAGIWKPRTRPDIFEGVGEQGLEWLKELKDITGLKTCVEVATPEHIDMALNWGVDILWIGARTTVNPFSVQILADALKGTDSAVMIKNPLNPDLKLWIGAFERMNNAGITKLAGIHRGFHAYDNKPYRNLPMWEIPIELKRILPNLPVICDPSHISGKRELLHSVSQKALDLSFDGLMIESHYNPDIALTDAKQQLTPKALAEMLDKLVIRDEFGTEDFEQILTVLRHEIDDMDHELFNILSRRNEKTQLIGKYKKENNITVLQLERLRLMMKDRINYGEELGMDKTFINKLLMLVHKESIRIQTNIMQDK
ncbi:MAG: bifunctional 3-deoxy-7-phosphoheptulonate synthase/chorismate mutase type II [Bacteroidales bacterium]|nr:bifunctional 3-deoxy-7-phosphoheptulonate synthase/chorismate mutase type II [Bacteroidales bacterium]